MDEYSLEHKQLTRAAYCIHIQTSLTLRVSQQYIAQNLKFFLMSSLGHLRKLE